MAPFFPPLNLPEAVILLITDELAAPADFVLHRTLTTHLKKPIQRVEGQQNKTRAVILSVSEGLGRWKALASKLVGIKFFGFLWLFELMGIVCQEYKPTKPYRWRLAGLY